MKLSIVIPCYNEAPTIEAVVNRVLDMDYPDKELVIVDDLSTDGTREILRDRIEQRVARVIYHERNMGKGAALRTGFKATTGAIVIVQDADMEYDPADIPKVIGPILRGKADVVYGTRFSGGEEHRVLYFWHMLGNRFLTFLSNMLTNLNLTDIEIGYKAFKGDVIRSIGIEEDRFGFEPEITAKVARMGLRIYEVGISYSGRTYEEGKKIGWRDGFRAIWCILKYNLARR